MYSVTEQIEIWYDPQFYHEPIIVKSIFSPSGNVTLRTNQTIVSHLSLLATHSLLWPLLHLERHYFHQESTCCTAPRHERGSMTSWAEQMTQSECDDLLPLAWIHHTLSVLSWVIIRSTLYTHWKDLTWRFSSFLLHSPSNYQTICAHYFGGWERRGG